MKLRTLVVDDEPIARRRILRLLSGEKDVEVIGECADGQEAVAAIREEAPDLVFLDVQMPEMDGFDVLEAVGPERMPAVIFVTAFDQYAIRAFEVHALDYLLKPFDADRFREALSRARGHMAENGDDRADRLLSVLEELTREQNTTSRSAPAAKAEPLERLMVKSGGRFLFLRVEEIDWAEAEGNYVRLHVGKDSYLIRETLSNLTSRLDPAQFQRIHRSTLINLDRIRELRPWFAGDYLVIMRDGTELKLSRTYREHLMERLG